MNDGLVAVAIQDGSRLVELKDEEMQQKDEEVAANRDELAANRAEIASLKAQLQKQTQPDEGLPPV